jgi:AAA domain
VGSYNSKYSPAVRVEALWGTGQPVDISELEDLVTLLPAEGMFAQRQQEQTTGFDGEPVDIEQRLRDMHPGNIHDTQLSVSAALLNRGSAVDEVVETLLKRTREVADDPQAWEWDEERTDIRRRCLDWITKHPKLAGALPDKLRDDFSAKRDAGREPRLVYVPAWDDGSEWSGWLVRSRRHDAKNDGPATDKKGKSGWSFYDSTKPQPIKFTVKKLVPEQGVGILSGQWGSFKTTTALDLSLSVMTGESFAGRYRVKRQGAVLYLCNEGAATLQTRLTNIAMTRGAPGKLPFAWRSDAPALTDKGAADTLIKFIDEAAAHFEATYGMSVVLLWIDTWAGAAGLEGCQDNEVFSTSKVLRTDAAGCHWHRLSGN